MKLELRKVAVSTEPKIIAPPADSEEVELFSWKKQSWNIRYLMRNYLTSTSRTSTVRTENAAP